MSTEIEELKDLQTKIQNTWELLRLDEAVSELRELENTMQAVDFWNNTETASSTSRRYEDLKSDVGCWSKMRDEVDELLSFARELRDKPDLELESELAKRTEELKKEFAQLEFYILFSGKHDRSNAIVAIYAGSGGTEAQDWAEMLRRMILRYAERKGWSATVLDDSRGIEAGIKSSVMRVEGRYAYGYLQSEHGTHRLVRISPFDAEQMRHTSFALIEVLPEIETSEAQPIDPKDLRIDTFMSGGKGGQSVNTTYSAVRVVHIPTGITVQCQNERSQLQNKETALKILQAKLLKLKEEAEEQERQKLRGEFKSPEWGSQIRSYVLHPYHMVKDLRTRYETADTDAVLNGELDEFVEAYLKWKKMGKG